MNPSVYPLERPYRLLICYAHENEAVKDRLKHNLAPQQRNGLLQIVQEQPVIATTQRVELTATGIDVAIFLLDKHFLASNLCRNDEIAGMLHALQDSGVLNLFVIADNCNWKHVDFVGNHSIIPSDGHPILSHIPHSEAYTRAAGEIADAIARHPQRALPDMQQPAAPTSLAALLAKLPMAADHLIGRDAELEKIKALHHHKGVQLWIGEAGTGKSALISSYLKQQSWPDGTHFIGDSFHGSSRPFLLDALKQLNTPHDERASDDELGRQLAAAVALEPAVLVLDGIETLQQPADDARHNGRIVDRGLTALLEGLVRKPGLSLCLVSSRLPIPEHHITRENFFNLEWLGLLAPDDARALLRQRGIRGDDAELGRMAKRCGRHPLSLILAAEFCHAFLQNKAVAFLGYQNYPNTEKANAATVATWLEGALSEEHQALDRELLRILGLFDRPAPWGALLALHRARVIPGMTVALHAADETAIVKALARLNQWGLLQIDLTDPAPTITTHPLITEHCAARIKKETPKAWPCAHSVLFDWFCNQADKLQPDKLAQIAPLYRAIQHGCAAGRYRSAYQAVYQHRILRGRIYYTQNQLGAYSLDLDALAGFFPQGWSQPPVTAAPALPDEALEETACTKLLTDAAYALKSLGRLEEALGPQWIGHQRTKEAGDWNNFCRSAENLVSLLTPLGRWREAEAVSREAVSAAYLIEDLQERWQRMTSSLACLGQTLHGRGFLQQASTAYALAEMVQSDAHHHPKLYSVYGYNYAQLLLEQASQEADWREVLTRKHTSLDIVEKLDHPLSQALDHSAIGTARAALCEPDTVRALDLAVTTMQRAGTVIHLPAMYLARAHYLRSLQDLPAAWVDFEIAHTIARRSNMRSYLAECALLGGNLCLDEGRVADAAAHYVSALQLITEDGYGRRLTEIHLLHARLLFAQHETANNALNDARNRIVAAGQWYFWRDLCAVAGEIGAPDPGACPAPP